MKYTYGADGNEDAPRAFSPFTANMEDGVAFAIYLTFEDKTREKIGEFESLFDATEYQLALAENLGLRPRNYDGRKPVEVAMYNGPEVKFVVAIVSGGLAGHKGGPKLRSI